MNPSKYCDLCQFCNKNNDFCIETRMQNPLKSIKKRDARLNATFRFQKKHVDVREWLQKLPKCSQDTPKTPQESPKTLLRGSKKLLRRSKDTPRGSQKPPKTLKRLPRRLWELPRPPQGLPRAQGPPQGAHGMHGHAG